MISIENDTPAVLDAFEDVSSINSSQPRGIRELRKWTRYRASWRVTIIVESQDLHEGRIKDISILAGSDVPKIMIVHGITSHVSGLPLLLLNSSWHQRAYLDARLTKHHLEALW